MMEDWDDTEDIAYRIVPSKLLKPEDTMVNNLFSILSINSRSICNKFSAIRDLTQQITPSILCIQETWNTNNSTDYSIRGYHKPILCTRSSMGSTRNGGGVGLWIKDDIDYEEINTTNEVGIYENITVRLEKYNTILTNLYRPPNNTDRFWEILNQNLEKIKENHKKEDKILIGDINIDLMKESQASNMIISCLLEYKMVQHVTIPTRIAANTRSLIDHAYIGSKKIFRSDVITTDISDHLATITYRTEGKTNKSRLKTTKRWFNPTAYDNLKLLLGAEDWSPMDNMNTDNAAEYLQTKINEYSDIVAPVTTKYIKVKKVNQWTTKGIKTSIVKCNKLYMNVVKKRKKGLIAVNEVIEYKKYKKILTKVNRKAKELYYNNLIEDCGTDVRRLWSVLNEVVDRKQCKHKYPNKFTHKGKHYTNKKDIANLFNTYFTHIGQEMANKISKGTNYEAYLSKVNSTFKLKEATEDQISKIMSAQQPKLSCGIDSINNKLVKNFHKELANPMTKIINKSIQESKVPKMYKIGRLIPLFKKGNQADCGNYRPVSLLSSLSKILEKVISGQMMHYLNTHNLLCPDQFGFRPKSQTNHVVQKLINDISKNATANKVTIATYLDLSKAFDCIQYEILYKKLEYLGFDSKTIAWFKDYLSGRLQCVDLDGTLSDWEEVQLGVPQGSILGPTLFLLYINDVNNADKSASFTKFADDSTVTSFGNSIKEAASKMNVIMKNVDTWFDQNKLNLNPSKTRYMIFGAGRADPDCDSENLIQIRNEPLQRVWRKGKEKAFKLVGIWIDEELKWSEHIAVTHKKINSAIYGISKTGRQLSIKNKRLMYMGLIQSHLVYGNPFWGHATKGRLQPLFTAQKRAIRNIHGLHRRDHTHKYFIKSEILKLNELISYTNLTYIHGSIDKNSPENIGNLWKEKPVNKHFSLRDRKRQLTMSTTKYQWILDLPNNKQAKEWNNSPVDIYLRKNPYKLHLKKYYLEQYKLQQE